MALVVTVNYDTAAARITSRMIAKSTATSRPLFGIVPGKLRDQVMLDARAFQCACNLHTGGQVGRETTSSESNGCIRATGACLQRIVPSCDEPSPDETPAFQVSLALRLWEALTGR